MNVSVMREKLSDGSFVFNVTYSDQQFGGTKITFGMNSEAAAHDLAAALAECAWVTVD